MTKKIFFNCIEEIVISRFKEVKHVPLEFLKSLTNISQLKLKIDVRQLIKKMLRNLAINVMIICDPSEWGAAL